MKLHLPKNLFLIALAMTMTQPLLADGEAGTDITTEYNPDEEIMVIATLGDGNIKNSPDGTFSYINVGTGSNTQEWKGDLTVGDIKDKDGNITSEGKVNKVGAFDETSTSVTFKQPNGKTTYTNNFKVNGTLTVQGDGQIVLGGQYYKEGYEIFGYEILETDRYQGLEANNIVVTGGSVTSTKITTNSINISEGSISTSTNNCTSGNKASVYDKKTYIKKSLTQSGGTLSFGYTSNVQGVGGGNHIMTAFGNSQDFTVTQSGGTMSVYGDMQLKSGSTITQSDAAELMILRDTIYMDGADATTFEQSGNSAKLLIGRLESTSSRNQCNFVFNQSGSGLIHLAYGSNLASAGSITFNQTGSGTINIGGGHDTKLTGSLPTRDDYSLTSFEAINTTYNFNQSGTGTINVNGTLNANQMNIGGESTLNINTNVTASSITQSDTSTINVNSDMNADSVKLNGGKMTVAGGATLTADTITIDGGTLINGSAQPVATLDVEGDINSLSDTMSMLSTVETGGIKGNVVVNSGEYIEYGNLDGSLTIQDGGQVTLNENANVNEIIVAGGKLVVTGGATTGSINLSKGTMTFEAGAQLTLQEGAEVELGKGFEIIVQMSADELAALGNGSEVTLFGDDTNTLKFTNTVITFKDDQNNKVTATVTGNATGGKVTVNAVVPEPTTATLSLLALAALAARRRRK